MSEDSSGEICPSFLRLSSAQMSHLICLRDSEVFFGRLIFSAFFINLQEKLTKSVDCKSAMSLGTLNFLGQKPIEIGYHPLSNVSSSILISPKWWTNI